MDNSKKTIPFSILLTSIFLSITLSTSLSWAQLARPSSIPCKTKGVPLPLPDVTLELITRGLSEPIHITHAKDNSGRLFITEQSGTIRIFKNGKLLHKPFLDIRERVVSGGEMGLLSVAFHPSFKENGRFFVNYTTAADNSLHTVVSEFRVGPNPDRADKRSEKVILSVAQPFSNHNGGQVTFGPDGYLYIGMGDGGAGNDPFNHGQDLSTLLGSMLRIDVDRRKGGESYAVPDDNPFRARPKARPEIWAYGLRNPWRFSFDPLTGTMYAGDVGQDAREEIDIIKPGKNYGWNIMEGSICTPGVNLECDFTGLTPPIADYGRDEGITVIGGFVYRGAKIPALCGAYIYGDFGSGKIWALQYHDNKVARKRLLLDTEFMISSFGIDEDYEVYVVDHSGAVYKMREQTAPP